jgi:small subunit ribosomal protein S18
MARIIKKPKFERPRKKIYIKDESQINYKNIAFLNDFISDRGKIRPRSITGITVQQQRAIARAIKNAREMALLPYVSVTRKKR